MKLAESRRRGQFKRRCVCRSEAIAHNGAFNSKVERDDHVVPVPLILCNPDLEMSEAGFELFSREWVHVHALMGQCTISPVTSWPVVHPLGHSVDAEVDCVPDGR